MSMQYVRIYYGPNESFGTVSHKPQKLCGIREYLQRLGFRVDLVPVEYINYCMLEMCGHEVFRCNINNLLFNAAAERDSVCRRAINAVVESSAKFLRARSYLWSWALIEDQIFRRSEYSPKDYWPFNFDGSFDTCLECESCIEVIEKKCGRSFTGCMSSSNSAWPRKSVGSFTLIAIYIRSANIL